MNIVWQLNEEEILLFSINLPVLESFVQPYHGCSAWTISPEGRGNTHNTSLVPNVGPMVCGHPVISLPSRITIGWYRAAAWHPNFQSHMKIIFSHWETAHKYMTFPRHMTTWLQAAECSDSIHVHYQYILCLHMKGRTLPNLPTGDIEVCGKWYSVFPGGTMARGWLSKKECHPKRTVTPEQERGSPRHPWGSKQIYSFVNSAHRVSSSENIQKCQGHVKFLNARDMNLHLKS